VGIVSIKATAENISMELTESSLVILPGVGDTLRK
jgi:hypothetical protein